MPVSLFIGCGLNMLASSDIWSDGATVWPMQSKPLGDCAT